MATKKRAASPKKPEASMTYSLTLDVGDKRYEAEGDTVLQAVEQIRPVKFTSRGKLLAKKGGKTREILIGVPQLRKMFLGSLFIREMYAKRLTVMLG